LPVAPDALSERKATAFAQMAGNEDSVEGLRTTAGGAEKLEGSHSVGGLADEQSTLSGSGGDGGAGRGVVLDD
jgi:hypothetical protein